jgi:hypothetical protein
MLIFLVTNATTSSKVCKWRRATAGDGCVLSVLNVRIQLFSHQIDRRHTVATMRLLLVNAGGSAMTGSPPDLALRVPLGRSMLSMQPCGAQVCFPLFVELEKVVFILRENDWQEE